MKKYVIVSLCIIAILVGGYFISQLKIVKTPLSTEKITIAQTVDTTGLGLMYIAEHQGYFQDVGLEVVYKKFPRGYDALTDVMSGDSDISLTYETPVVRKIYEGDKLHIISTLHASTQNTGIVARKDRGILSVNDLIGKRIGVTKNSSYEFFLYSYLSSQGINVNEVIIVDGVFGDLGAMLKEGRVDAVAVGNPFLYDVINKFSPESIAVFQSEVYTENSLLAGREDVLNNKKEAVIRFLTALDRAEKFYLKNNQEAINIVVAELPNISEGNIRATWDQQKLILVLNNVLLTILNREGQWFKDNGIYKDEVPDFRKTIFTEYLKIVNPEAVTIY